MDLKSLVSGASKTYELNLDDSKVQELCSRMRTAGYGTEITAKHVGRAIDTVLTMADQIQVRAPQAVYASLKQEAGAEPDGHCPRCRGSMKNVKLVGSREAIYCPACAITLPIKAE